MNEVCIYMTIHILSFLNDAILQIGVFMYESTHMTDNEGVIFSDGIMRSVLSYSYYRKCLPGTIKFVYPRLIL